MASIISVEMQPFSVSTFLVGIVMAKVPDYLQKRSPVTRCDRTECISLAHGRSISIENMSNHNNYCRRNASCCAAAALNAPTERCDRNSRSLGRSGFYSSIQSRINTTWFTISSAERRAIKLNIARINTPIE